MLSVQVGGGVLLFEKSIYDLIIGFIIVLSFIIVLFVIEFCRTLSGAKRLIDRCIGYQVQNIRLAKYQVRVSRV